MKTRQSALTIVLFVVIAASLAAALAGCGGPVSPPLPTPTITPNPEAGGGSLQVIPQGAVQARDSAWNFLLANYPDQNWTAQPVSWLTERVTPDNLVGSETYQFTSGDIKITVQFPVVAPGNEIYTVTVEKPGFSWKGEVNPKGEVLP